MMYVENTRKETTDSIEFQPSPKPKVLECLGILHTGDDEAYFFFFSFYLSFKSLYNYSVSVNEKDLEFITTFPNTLKACLFDRTDSETKYYPIE